MPISSDEFDKGKIKDPLNERIMQFLSRNPSTAYNAEEIFSGLNAGGQPLSNDLLALLVALGYLTFTNQIAGKFIVRPGELGTFYYRIKS